MIQDLVVSILGSLIVALITGFLGNKAISKNSSIILQVYVLFLAGSSFVISAMVFIVLNQDIIKRMQTISETNMLRFYHNCLQSFVFAFLIIAVTTIFIIILEAFDRND